MPRLGGWLVAFVAAAALFVGGTASASTIAHALAGPAKAVCSSGYVDAHLSWGDKCLRAGEFCEVGNPEYHAYGFDCPASGYLTYYSQPTSPPTTTAAPPTTTPVTTAPPSPTTPAIDVGRTVLLKKQTKTRGCKLGALSDRRCSPGAYYTGLTKTVLCSARFHTSSVRHVTESEMHQVEVEYGLVPKEYGRTLEIDHIVSLELGGSNDIANLYPEEAKFAGHAPGYQVKDKLENKVHALVCSGAMRLRTAQRDIASNWEKLYRRVFGVAPRG